LKVEAHYKAPEKLFVLTFAFWIFYYELLDIFFNGMIV